MVYYYFSLCFRPSMRFRQRNQPEKHQRNSIATPAKNIFLLFLPILRLMLRFPSALVPFFHPSQFPSDVWLKHSALNIQFALYNIDAHIAALRINEKPVFIAHFPLRTTWRIRILQRTTFSSRWQWNSLETFVMGYV